MKVVVLTTGRSGSVSLYHACKLAKNYAAGHESKAGALASERCNIANNFIEVDNRLAWFLGRLAENDQGDVHYGFLRRSSAQVASSYNRRWEVRKGMMRGYCEGFLQRDKSRGDMAVAQDMVETIESNIALFLKDRPHSVLNLETIDTDLPKFFDAIGADIDVEQALDEFRKKRNSSNRTNPIFWLRLRVSLLMDKAERLLLSLRKRRH